MLTGSIIDTYHEQLLPFFNNAIEQQGSELYRLLASRKIIMANSAKMLSEDVTNPYWLETAGGDTQYGQISTDHRILRTNDVAYSILEDAYLTADQGHSESETIARHAARMANRLQLFCENYLINGKNGIGGIAGTVERHSANGGNATIPFKAANTIYAGDIRFGTVDTIDTTNTIKYGLSVSKILAASALMCERFATMPKVCVTSSFGAYTLMSDPRYANVQYNPTNASIITGRLNPIQGIQYFVISEYVPKDLQMHKADGTDMKYDDGTNVFGEYAYVFSLDHFIMGQKPIADNIDWDLSVLPDPTKNHNLSVLFRGSIGACRLDEDAFYRIEVARLDPTKKMAE